MPISDYDKLTTQQEKDAILKAHRMSESGGGLTTTQETSLNSLVNSGLDQAKMTDLNSMPSASEVDGSIMYIGFVENYGASPNNTVEQNTTAIEKAIETVAQNGGGTVLFNHIYTINRALVGRSNVTFKGIRGKSGLTKRPAVTQLVTSNINIGDTIINVEDGSSYEVGNDCFIFYPTTISPVEGTRAKITAINGNQITIEAYLSNGAKNNYLVSDGAYFSSSHALITTNGTLYPSENLTIEDLYLDGNAQDDEPKAWILAPIHIDPQTFGTEQNRNTIRNNYVLNSPSDGISIQSEYDAYVIHNHVKNCKEKGIHVGTTIENVRVYDNIIEDCQEGAMYWCYQIYKMVFSGNTIKNCTLGCFGLDIDADTSIITNNIFDNTTSYSIFINGAKNLIISNNTFKNLNQSQNNSCVEIFLAEHITLNSNSFENQTGLGEVVNILGSNDIKLIGNKFPTSTGSHSLKIDLYGATRSSSILSVGNNYNDGLVEINGCDYVSFASDNIHELSINNNAIDTKINNCNILTMNDKGLRTKINNQAQESLNGDIPNLSNYNIGESVKDKDTDSLFVLANDGINWLKVATTEESGIDLIYKNGIETLALVQGYSNGSDSNYSKNVDNIEVTAYDTGSLQAWSLLVADSQIDLTNVNYLYVDWEYNGTSGYHYAELLLHPTDKLTSSSTLKLSNRNGFDRRLDKLDVSGLTGNYYIKVGCRGGTTQISSTVKFYTLGYK